MPSRILLSGSNSPFCSVWTAQQVVDAFPWETAPRYLLRDRDGVYGPYFIRRIEGLGIDEVRTATSADENHASLSPDGRWLAYRSNESGENEVYVQPFPGPGRRVQVSTDGGTNPKWNPTGGELFYRSRGRTMVVDVAGTDELVFGRPRVLFENPQTPDNWPFGISPDGERFAMVSPSRFPKSTSSVSCSTGPKS